VPLFRTSTGVWPRGAQVRRASGAISGPLSSIALTGDALRLPRGEPAVPEPGAEVPRIEPNAELLSDQLAPPRRRPKLGLETVVSGTLGQPAQGDLLLGRGQLPGPPRDGSGAEADVPLVAKGSHPPAHGGRIDPEEVGDLLGRVPSPV
jgi:hypothetical protein